MAHAPRIIQSNLMASSKLNTLNRYVEASMLIIHQKKKQTLTTTFDLGARSIVLSILSDFYFFLLILKSASSIRSMIQTVCMCYSMQVEFFCCGVHFRFFFLLTRF